MAAEALDRFGEIEINAEAGLADAAAFVADGLRGARCHVARDKIAEARVAALQIIIALVFGDLAGRPLVAGCFGTQMRPSLRSDSDISVSFDW